MNTRTLVIACLLGWTAAACRGDGPAAPLDVPLGETTFVFVVNPVVNDANEAELPAPGDAREGVSVALQGGPSGSTDAGGVEILRPVEAGTRTVILADDAGNSGDLSLDIVERDLLEIAVALNEGGAARMAEVHYAFGGEVVEITSDMSVADVNEALSGSNRIVFLRGGSYAGDVEFSGSNVTLFGEGAAGGGVTLDGNVVVSGSGNRLRGARITGDLLVTGSDAGISFSAVAGSVHIDGSDTVLLQNGFCGSVTVDGSGLTALGNAGLTPLPAPSQGC